MSKSIITVMEPKKVAGTAITLTNKGVMISSSRSNAYLETEPVSIAAAANGEVALIEHRLVEEWFVCLYYDVDDFLRYARTINEAAQAILNFQKQSPKDERSEHAREAMCDLYKDVDKMSFNEDDKQPPQDQDADQHAKDTAKAAAKDEAARLDRREGKLTSVSQASREKLEEDFLADVAAVRKDSQY